MTPKHWRQKNLSWVSLDDLEKFADALGCSKWEISRVEIGGRLFRHAIPERERKAPPIPESESSDSEGDDISLGGGRELGVIDPTWRPTGLEYFGVPLELMTVAKLVAGGAMAGWFLERLASQTEILPRICRTPENQLEEALRDK